MWDDQSVEVMFDLRYREMADEFDTRNKHGLKQAYGALAAELSTTLGRVFTARQIQDKISKSKNTVSLAHEVLWYFTYGNCVAS